MLPRWNEGAGILGHLGETGAMMQLSRAIASYILDSQIGGKTPKTVQVIKWDLQRFQKWVGDVPLESITTDQLREYILFHKNRNLSGYSVHDIYKILHAFLNWCLQDGLLATDPSALIPRPKLPELLPRVLTQQQVELLAKRLKKNKSAMGQRNLLIVMMLLDCGLRVSELSALTTEDMRLDDSYIVVKRGKGEKGRLVPVSPNLHRYIVRYLTEYRDDFDPRGSSLFLGRGGKSLQTVAVQHLVRRALRGIGVKGGPHLLRHTFATMYLRNGGDLERLRRVLGHSDLSVIQRYLHLVPEDLVTRHERISPLARLGL